VTGVTGYELLPTTMTAEVVATPPIIAVIVPPTVTGAMRIVPTTLMHHRGSGGRRSRCGGRHCGDDEQCARRGCGQDCSEYFPLHTRSFAQEIVCASPNRNNIDQDLNITPDGDTAHRIAYSLRTIGQRKQIKRSKSRPIVLLRNPYRP